MRRKILIFNLLFALALLPVAQAVVPAPASMDSTHTMPMDGGHEMTMDCGPGDHGDCFEVDCCSGGGHASCDANAKATQVSSRTADLQSGSSYASDPPARYLSNLDDLLLRPPRNA